jgi:DNA repair ATPase RecN
MGFGLHQGWAIEGAIGSFFKIDASYLSPNVNMASRLQAASKQYGVYILISHLFYYVLTPEVREICREIDRITVKGSNQPIRIYTVDMDVNGLEETNDRFKQQNMKEKKRNYEKEKKNIWHMLKTRKKTTAALITSDKDFQELRRNVEPAFETLFQQGYQHYLNGNWEQAKLVL